MNLKEAENLNESANRLAELVCKTIVADPAIHKFKPYQLSNLLCAKLTAHFARATLDYADRPKAAVAWYKSFQFLLSEEMALRGMKGIKINFLEVDDDFEN